jgi:hypothetical protein
VCIFREREVFSQTPVGSHINVKVTVIFIATLLLFDTTLCGQTRFIQGRVISQELEPLPYVQIQNKDTILFGKTDINGRFKIETPQQTQTLILSWVGLERTKISLQSDCDTLEIIMLYAGTYDFMSPKKIDRQRLKQFNKLSELHLQAYNKGLFTKSTVCYSRQFEPKKSILDSIRQEMIKQQKQNKITFDTLKVGDKVRIPFSTEYNSDGTHRTTLIVYSIFAYKLKYDCIIEAVITDKNYNNNGYNLVCKITSDNLCKSESVYNGKTMKIGEVFVHNMKYFKVLTE